MRLPQRVRYLALGHQAEAVRRGIADAHRCRRVDRTKSRGKWGAMNDGSHHLHHLRGQPARAEAEVALVVGRMKPTIVALSVLPVSNS